jgi:hypothetical protein
MNELQLTSEIENSIITQLMNGTPLTKICKAKDSPSLSKVYKWIATNKEFADKILTARRIGAQTYLDSMIEELEGADNRNIQVVREKLHHYRWLASKLIGIYGDKQEIRTDSKIEITWNVPDVNTNTNTNVIDVSVSPDDNSLNSSVVRT